MAPATRKKRPSKDKPGPDPPSASGVYDESKITTLSSVEHIRLRPGMYIGRLGDGSHPDDGIYVLLKEVVDNSIDEYIMGHGKRIDIDIDDKGHVEVRDFGRGIPLGKLLECVSVINTGGKFNDDVFQFSVGLNGVGTKAVNALSSHFEVASFRDGKSRHIVFEHGSVKKDLQSRTSEKNGSRVAFVPSPDFFKDFRFREDILKQRIRTYSYLNPGLTLRLNGEKFMSRGGLKDLLTNELSDEPLYEILHYRGPRVEFAFTHTAAYGESYDSFVNGQYTNDGGTHESAFREGMLKGVNLFSKKSYDGKDVREGVRGAIAIKLKDPVFESQTKNKLGNTDIRGELVTLIRDQMADLLHKNKAIAQKIMEKVGFNEKLRKELQAVTREARDRAKKAAIKIPGLRDCKWHRGDTHRKSRGEESMIFLTEGQSASGNIVSCRDVDIQAIFSLRGKPLNCFGHRRDTVYKNDELYNVMKSLRIEDDHDALRYEKIILATDADVDGLHIRNLLMCFFLHYFEPVVRHGHLYILETPLFRVRSKNETQYCYTEKERDAAQKKLGAGAETTRFKGLGEISPREFGQFIHKNTMRLQPVRIDQKARLTRTLEFYMGKNTPERKEFIMENLV